MSLDQEQPEAMTGFRDPLGFVKKSDASPCQQCGVLTHWSHIALDVPVCSHVCFNRLVAVQATNQWVEP